MLVHDGLIHTASKYPGQEALVCGQRRWVYEDIDGASDYLAGHLVSSGLERGDRVVVFMDNSAEAVIALYAILKAGGVMVPVNPLTKAGKLAFILRDAEAFGLISEAHLQGIWEAACVEYQPRAVIVRDARAQDAAAGRADFWQACLQGQKTIAAMIDQDLAALIYTSGSTGEPKGVMLSHLNMVSAAASVGTYLGLRTDDRILCCLPLAFDYGLYQVLLAFRAGACVVLERSFAFPAALLATMEREKATVFPGVPTMFSMLLGMEGLVMAHDLRSLRMITNTAAALPPSHIERLCSLFPNAAVYSMYGLTECKRVTYLPPEDIRRKPGSVGRGMPNQEVYLVDPDGRRLPPGSIGELVVRGSHVMRGYWRRPEETARSLRPGRIPGEQVLHSGDIFHMDEDGYLYFIGRSDDVIKSRGEKVCPKEIENCLYAMDGVVEAAVVGVDDEVLGQAVHAFVVLRDRSCCTDRDLLRHCHAHLESYMVPQHIHVVQGLPKTDTGKIKKTGLCVSALRSAQGTRRTVS
ncbi:MAG: AMP-binding protein [Gammaproteobacteria bacterium]|nr:AMP-binding protein [Gammaproteobacteria bacterium]